MATALRHNPSQDITGMLYYDRDTQKLVQLLEGPKVAVVTLFNSILNDSRHHSCELLYQDMVESRVYSDFGMGLARLSGVCQMQLVSCDLETGHQHAQHLVRIQYASTLLAGDSERGREMIREILQQAVRNNTTRGIGGLLIFNPSTMSVVQLLEGPAAAVRDLFTTIMADRRHEGCQLTNEELLLSREEYLFDERWGLMQSETHDTDLLDLSVRIRQAYKTHTSSKLLKLPMEELLATVLVPVGQTPSSVDSM